MKKFLIPFAIVFAMLFTSFEANAQDYEILRLKDGTEITGVIERLPDGSVSITDLGGNTFVFSADEIEAIMTEQQKKEDEAKARLNAKLREKIARREARLNDRMAKWEAKKDMNFTYAGFVEGGLGYSLLGGVGVSAGMVNSLKFSPYFYMGVGVDVRTTAAYNDWSTDQTSQQILLPVYFNIRYSILGGKPYKASPFVASNIGYDVLGVAGVMFEVYVGVELKTFKTGSLWLAVDLPTYLTGNALIDVGIKAGWSF